MTGSADRLSRWIFLLTAGFLFTATVLRSVLAFAGDPYLIEVLLLLLAWLVLFALEVSATARRRRRVATSGRPTSSWGPLLPALHGRPDRDRGRAPGTSRIRRLLRRSLRRPEHAGDAASGLEDGPRVDRPVRPSHGPPADPHLRRAAGRSLSRSSTWPSTRSWRSSRSVNGRAAEARARNQVLADELRVANGDIEAYSRQIERLAATSERHRLARELHDSVTQTVFSMNLTAQSAALLLARDRSAASAQLERLEELTQSALAEIRHPGRGAGPGFRCLRRRRSARAGWRPPSAATSRSGACRTGSRSRCTWKARRSRAPLARRRSRPSLSAAEELGLFRIAQEALNNIVKHAADERGGDPAAPVAALPSRDRRRRPRLPRGGTRRAASRRERPEGSAAAEARRRACGERERSRAPVAKAAAWA